MIHRNVQKGREEMGAASRRQAAAVLWCLKRSALPLSQTLWLQFFVWEVSKEAGWRSTCEASSQVGLQVLSSERQEGM